MKKLLLTLALLIFVLSACSHTAYIRKNPEFLKPGLHASAFLEVWGQPDETMSYLDYQNKQYQYSSSATWNKSGGGYSSYGSTYTPEMLVWVYYKNRKVLFFSRNRISSGMIPIYAAYELVGWENLPEPPKSKEGPKALESPEKGYQREITFADGSKYIGNIANGSMHGQGTYIWPSGDKYVGEFADNRATGGWFYKTTGQKVWVYQDPEGKWITKQ